jgi:uncharacterized protein
MFARPIRAALLCAALLVAAPALAQQKAPTPADPAAVAAAKDLLLAMGSMKQFEIAINTMSRGMANEFKKQLPAKGKEIDDVMELMAAKFNARKDEMLTLVAPLYAEKFTVAELTEIGAFYKTPIGQKMIATQPEILQRSMQIGMAWGATIGKEVEAEARKELKKRGVDL